MNRGRHTCNVSDVTPETSAQRAARTFDDAITQARPAEIRRRLTLRPPKNPTIAKLMDSTRERVIRLGETLERTLPPGRELALALTKLEECSYWAIAAIARNQDDS